jgi:hypothetical protein
MTVAGQSSNTVSYSFAAIMNIANYSVNASSLTALSTIGGERVVIIGTVSVVC